VIDVLTAELRAPLAEESAELYVGGTVFKTGPPDGPAAPALPVDVRTDSGEAP
jgi:hypothetical protein